MPTVLDHTKDESYIHDGFGNSCRVGEEFIGSYPKLLGYYECTINLHAHLFIPGNGRSVCDLDKWAPERHVNVYEPYCAPYPVEICRICSEHADSAISAYRNNKKQMDPQMSNTLDPGSRGAPGNEDSHYSGSVQPIDLCEAQGWAPAAYQFSVVKYVTRYQEKGGILDLEKAKWFLERLIQYEKGLEEKRSQKRLNNS